MNDTNTRRKRIIITSIIAIAFVVFVVIIAFVIGRLNSERSKVIIDNITSCSPNLSNFLRENAETGLYSVVVAQNSLSNTQNAATYHATLVDGTCDTQEYNLYDPAVYTTTATAIITGTPYTYKISYTWIPSSTPLTDDVDLGSLSAFCPKDVTFDCAANPAISVEQDPIFSILPYAGDHFILSTTTSTTSLSGYAVVVTVDPPESVYLTGQPLDYAAERVTAAKAYLTAYHLDPANYEFITKFKIIN